MISGKALLSVISAAAALSAAVCSCSAGEDALQPGADGKMPICLSGEITANPAVKADVNGFSDNDVVGIYIVDYDDDVPGDLKDSGNRADNLMFTFDAKSYIWNPAYEVYWKDGHTHIDIYGYYPYGSPADVENYSFEIEKDQGREAAYGKPGGYEASDFLWGKASDIAPTDQVIKIRFSHMMAAARVTLMEGVGFEDGEWDAAQKQVVITSTTRQSLIDLKTGRVTAVGEASEEGTVPKKEGNDFRAILVPQTVPAGKPLMSITIGGNTWYFRKNEDFTYVPSRQHSFSITVSKRTETGEYVFEIADESIIAWETDSDLHDATAREYVIIDVWKPGTLEESIIESGKDPGSVRNMKVTGWISSRDFATMKYHMPKLSSLNLKEARIMAGSKGTLEDGNGYLANEAGEIPKYAMFGCQSLMRLILPDNLKSIGAESFYGCSLLTGSLTIPEGVETIGYGAFRGCSFTGNLVLPMSLKQIGAQAFLGNSFYCELKLPENLEIIENEAFYDCDKLFGRIVLPSRLAKLGYGAFHNCNGISGGLEIPQTLTNLENDIFSSYRSNPNMNGTLVLHDGIESIGAAAFKGAAFRGELKLPKNLTMVMDNAFNGCDFSGTLVIPKSVMAIGAGAFSGNWRLTGTVTINQEIQSIGNNAFYGCRGIEGVIFENGVEVIGSGAFSNCSGINRIVCKSSTPPNVLEGAFDGVPKDAFTLEVPASAVQKYQVAEGWKDFKRISAYRNLSVSPATAGAVNTSVTRSLTLSAEGEWCVESCPDWISLDKMSGNGKTELVLTFSPLAYGAGDREGEVVFLLKDKEYRMVCKVAQYDCRQEEDEFITLNRATRGNGINIVFLGDGYSAKDIKDGKLADNVGQAFSHFFDIEPYRTYKDYFNVHTAVSVSAESGIGGVNTIVQNKFSTTAKGDQMLGGRNGESDFRSIMDYVCSHISGLDLDRTLVVMVPNTGDYSGITYLWDGGFAISYCPVSGDAYPYDFRGVIQHEAGGHGFGKLGDECISHNTFIDNCGCSCCPHVTEFNQAKSNGWYDNLSLSGKMSEVPWSHLVNHERYKDFVDIYEGGFMHSRGVFRSEYNSCMNNDVPYYNTVSRESIVRRIMTYAGEDFSFEDFVAKDDINASSTRSGYDLQLFPHSAGSGHEPVLMGKLTNGK